jgi:hypothetical protein
MSELEWEDLDERTRMRMRWLGDFMPTRNHGSIRGWMHDKYAGYATEEYLTIEELRELGRACFRVALWLETRTRQAKPLTKKEVE